MKPDPNRLPLPEPVRRALYKLCLTERFTQLASPLAPHLDKVVHAASRGRLTVTGALLPVLLLTTRGRRSGLPRTTPIAYFQEPDGSRLVVASNYGKPGHPDWAANLLAHPAAHTRARGRGIAVTAEALEGVAYEEAWRKLLTVWPPLDEVQSRTERRIPVFRLAKSAPQSARTPRVAVIGAGVSGLCALAKLKGAGFYEVTVFERGQELGGTWSSRSYPGLTCDIPSSFFQYSFALRGKWPTRFASGSDINGYLHEVCDRLGLRRHIRYGQDVRSARFERGVWKVVTDGGEESFDFLITACGFMSDPITPQLPGLEDFKGTVIHSSAWDHQADLEGARVAMVGTGSSGVQIAAWLAPRAGHLTVFQRSAPWVVPRFNRRLLPAGNLLRERLPVLNTWSYRLEDVRHSVLLSRPLTHPGLMRRMVGAVCRTHLGMIRDPRLRADLTPDYEPMCKRVILSSQYYPTLRRDDVTLETSAITRVEPDAVVTADGRRHRCEALVFATGYDTHTYMNHIALTGPEGRTLAEMWQHGVRSFHGVAVPGLPNLFSVLGPFAPTGAYSAMAVAEMHADLAVHWIRRWSTGQISQVAPTQEATDRFMAAHARASTRTVWSTGCHNTYIGDLGVPEVSPWSPRAHRRALRNLDPADWHITTPVTAPQPQPLAGPAV